MIYRILTLSSFALAAAFAAPAAASTLIGQQIEYCTDSTRDGAVTNSPAACDYESVFVAGTTTIGNPVEVILDQGGTRRLDFFADTVDIIYNGAGSPSPDLFVVYGILADIADVSLVSANPLAVTWVYGGGALGILVGAPLEDGTVTLQFTFGRGVVPEPGTWAMMIAGFGLVGFAARRRSAIAAA